MKTFFIVKKKMRKRNVVCEGKIINSVMICEQRGKFEYLMMFFWQGKIFKNLRVNIAKSIFAVNERERENDDSFYRLRSTKQQTIFTERFLIFTFKKIITQKKNWNIIQMPHYFEPCATTNSVRLASHLLLNCHLDVNIFEFSHFRLRFRLPIFMR